MISIRSVKGTVAVFDETSTYLEPAAPGMVLKAGRNYLVVSDGKSEATITKDGKSTVVSPGEWYVINKKGKVLKGKHTEKGNVKLFLGRIWAAIARENPELNLPMNATIGVRG